MNKREWMLQAALMWIRAGHGGTADEAAAALSGTYDAICAASPETPQEGAWLDWHGEKPYPEGMVDYVTANGYSGTRDSDDLIWTHDGDMLGSEIIKWRPARD